MSIFQRIQRRRGSLNSDKGSVPEPELSLPAEPVTTIQEIQIAPNDPFVAYCQSVNGLVEIDKLQLDSPALNSLKSAGVKITVPLVSQGELIGLLNLGPRRSEQEYTSDDRRLLSSLATQAAPALRVAQLVKQQQIEASERERIAQELRVARVIQQTLLPKEVPQSTEWSIAAHWQPARAVSGDFYDFISFPDGKLALVVADVTDKGVPAALVMATTRSILQAVTEHYADPGKVLERTNNMLCPHIPTNMFVTCLYALLDPSSGHMRFANAGHNLPYLRTANGVVELRARGMPLGLMPEMDYEEKEIDISPGDELFLYSDGLVEAHNPAGEMFGFPRLRELLATGEFKDGLIGGLVEELSQFTGPGWEQEDDVTFVTLERLPHTSHQASPSASMGKTSHEFTHLAHFEMTSQPGNERQVMEQVASVVEEHLDLPKVRLERLKTAVAEATMNAMEHGSQYRLDLPVQIDVLLSSEEQELMVRIRDKGGIREIPDATLPNLEAKLEGLQSPRGWGLYLIKNMVDDVRVYTDEHHHTVELVLNIEGDIE